MRSIDVVNSRWNAHEIEHDFNKRKSQWIVRSKTLTIHQARQLMRSRAVDSSHMKNISLNRKTMSIKRPSTGTRVALSATPEESRGEAVRTTCARLGGGTRCSSVSPVTFTE
jgi:hypothetical protein